jgi:hypothetical protein
LGLARRAQRLWFNPAGRTSCPVFLRLEEVNYGTDFFAKPRKDFG